MNRSIAALLFVALCTLLACGPPPRPRAPTDADLRTIDEGRALSLIADTLLESGVRGESGWTVAIASEVNLPVDIRIPGRDFGIEWVSPQDRHDFGDAIPDPVSGQLRLAPGYGDDASAQILILDFVSYRYDPDRQRVQYGAPSIRDAESRLQRDVQDFLRHIDHQN